MLCILILFIVRATSHLIRDAALYGYLSQNPFIALLAYPLPQKRLPGEVTRRHVNVKRPDRSAVHVVPEFQAPAAARSRVEPLAQQERVIANNPRRRRLDEDVLA